MAHPEADGCLNVPDYSIICAFVNEGRQYVLDDKGNQILTPFEIFVQFNDLGIEFVEDKFFTREDRRLCLNGITFYEKHDFKNSFLYKSLETENKELFEATFNGFDSSRSDNICSSGRVYMKSEKLVTEADDFFLQVHKKDGIFRITESPTQLPFVSPYVHFYHTYEVDKSYEIEHFYSGIDKGAYFTGATNKTDSGEVTFKYIDPYRPVLPDFTVTKDNIAQHLEWIELYGVQFVDLDTLSYTYIGYDLMIFFDGVGTVTQIDLIDKSTLEVIQTQSGSYDGNSPGITWENVLKNSKSYDVSYVEDGQSKVISLNDVGQDEIVTL